MQVPTVSPEESPASTDAPAPLSFHDLGLAEPVLKALATLGYETLTAMDGESAWGLYQQRSPDVIISDWMMPGMDGLALCQAVRGAPGPSYTYLVLLSSLSA